RLSKSVVSFDIGPMISMRGSLGECAAAPPSARRDDRGRDRRCPWPCELGGTRLALPLPGARRAPPYAARPAERLARPALGGMRDKRRVRRAAPAAAHGWRLRSPL